VTRLGGQSARHAFHLDGWSGWSFVRDPATIAALTVTREGLSLARGPLPPAPPGPLLEAPQRGLALDPAGFSVGVTDGGGGLCISSDCGPLEPSSCWDLESLGDAEITGLASHGDWLFAALPARGVVRVLRATPAGAEAELVLGGGARPSAVACDARGHLYVLDANANRVHVWDSRLRPIEQLELAADIPLDLLAVSPGGWLAAGAKGGAFVLIRDPSGLESRHEVRPLLPGVAWIPGEHGGPPRLGLAEANEGHVVEFDLIGFGSAGAGLLPRRWSVQTGAWRALLTRGDCVIALGPDCAVTKLDFDPAGFYALETQLELGPLDSRDLETEWHRAVAAIRTLGAGDSSVSLQIVALPDCEEWNPDDPAPDARWSPPRSFDMASPRTVRELGFVHAHGQFAYLRLRLTGSGRGTPIVEWLRVEYPRESWLGYLPEIFSKDVDGADLLARLLSIAQAENADIQAEIDHSAALFSPRDVDPEFLPWLAQRIGFWLNPRWDEQTRRSALAEAFELYRRRGTRAALQRMLDLHVGTGVSIVEGFRSRSRFVLGQGAALGCDSTLPSGCGPEILRLGYGARLGAAKLDSGAGAIASGLGQSRGELWLIVPESLARDDERLSDLHELVALEAPAGTRVRTLRAAAGVLGRASRLGMGFALGRHSSWRLSNESDSETRAGPWLLASDSGARGAGPLGGGAPLGMGRVI
jgi:phage tail-like protein